MDIRYRQGRATECLQQARSILVDTRNAGSFDEERLSWLYTRNPDGEATLWLALAGDEVAGFAALVPRRVRVDGRVCRGWNTADLSVRDAYRRRGIATELRRRARSSVDRGEVELLYGNPNLKSEGAHRKAGFACLGRMSRYAKILRAADYAARFAPAPLGRIVGCAVDPFLRLAERSLKRDPDLSVRRIADTAFDSRFDDLFDGARLPRHVVGVRDQQYLRWRYGENPIDDHLVLIAERGATLCGYLVARQRDRDLEILDLFPPAEDLAIDALLAAVITTGREVGARSLTLSVLDGHPLLPVLQTTGFRLRKGHSHMFAYAAPRSTFAARVSSGALWAAMDGDRDV